MTIAIEQSREAKLEKLSARGINSYAYRFDETHSIPALHSEFDSILERKAGVSVSGRVQSLRKQGNNLWFIDIGSNRSDPHIQLMVKKPSLDEDSQFIVGQLDLNDFVGVHGVVMVTERGERTILVDKIEMLTKATRSLPKSTEHTEISDPEYLARMPEVAMIFGRKKQVLCNRAKIMAAFRRELFLRDLVEIETPYLNPFFGGAEARPFVTHVNALKMPVFLAISPEIELKRAVVGGFPGVFTMARNFRNEGVDATHNPEFTAMEAYVSNRDYNDMMSLTEHLVAEACKAVHGEYQCAYQDVRLDFTPPWPQLKMVELVSQRVGLDAAKLDADGLAAAAREMGLDRGVGDLDTASPSELRDLLLLASARPDDNEIQHLSRAELKSLIHRHHLHVPMDLSMTWGELILQLFERLVEPNLVQPCHVMDHPACSTMLCKTLRNGRLPNGEELVERFESYVYRMEISNAYSELNDPTLQEKLMRQQAGLRDSGHDDAMPYNTLFIESLQYGMPPCGGLGIGMDRIVMLLTDSRSIRDVIAFPLVRP